MSEATKVGYQKACLSNGRSERLKLPNAILRHELRFSDLISSDFCYVDIQTVKSIVAAKKIAN